MRSLRPWGRDAIVAIWMCFVVALCVADARAVSVSYVANIDTAAGNPVTVNEAWVSMS